MQRVKVMGRGTITNVHTSDLWPFTGKDGRDYALVGTWGGDGWAYIFDITDPTNLFKTDSVQVDARDDQRRDRVAGRSLRRALARGSIEPRQRRGDPRPREAGAPEGRVDVRRGPNRRRAQHVRDERLPLRHLGRRQVRHHRRARTSTSRSTSASTTTPTRASTTCGCTTGSPTRREWGTGVVAVDVGQRQVRRHDREAGADQHLSDEERRHHEIFPYFQKSTGKIYLFLGDESHEPPGAGVGGHELPERVEVSRAACRRRRPGTRTSSTSPTRRTRRTSPATSSPSSARTTSSSQDDILYQAYYDGGVRMVDVSGELLGNLARQGREIAVFKPYDPQGLHGERAVRDERHAVEGERFLHRLQQRPVVDEAPAESGRPVDVGSTHERLSSVRAR